MKKIIFIACSVILLQSCVSTSSTQWTINGDVTAYNMDGSILRKWENVVIESGYTGYYAGTQTTSNAIKTFGINFTDPKTLNSVIISNAVPCIIECKNKEYENMGSENYTPQNNTQVELFKSGEIFMIDKDRRTALENNFISEIKTDINSAKTRNDIITVKEKIEVLNAYHQKMPQKGSYFDILDALQLINIQLSKKARNLGVKL